MQETRNKIHASKIAWYQDKKKQLTRFKWMQWGRGGGKEGVVDTWRPPLTMPPWGTLQRIGIPSKGGEAKLQVSSYDRNWHPIELQHCWAYINNFQTAGVPPAAANVRGHLAAINTGFRSDIGLAVIMFPPIAWKEQIMFISVRQVS